MMNRFNHIAALGLITLLSACSTTPEIDLSQESATESAGQIESGSGSLPTSGARTSGVEVLPIGEGQGFNSETIAAGEGMASSSTLDMDRTYSPVIYFGFDQFSIDEPSMMTLRYYADQMLNNPNLLVTLEGHTDERGSPSYNLALGEKRANAVAEVMMLYGVSRERITNISFGEEQPAQMGHDEAAWAKNRRVELRFN
ncbi:MAG: OmpA family protein [Thiomicrospira sp.]|jgi:peptidoglycan-associated lipoprotein|nr:OmpA family protein [Thiomicrospira sp.]